jgi:D-glycero-D-manno-heptose 1,7-bisphosphate phosphatase
MLEKNGKSGNDSRKPAVFLDRDGTLNENPPRGGYTRRPEDLKLLAGVPEALRRLQDAGYLLVVFTNQSGVAYGLFTAEDVKAVNARLGGLLASHGVEIGGFYFCPHGRESTCGCRKPRPGLVLQAAEELRIDLARSWALGDAARDLEAGREAGCRGVVLVWGNSYPGAREEGEVARPDASVPDLAAAAEFILGQGS